jgi:uncharacterized protein YdhG (YjbR/CyaY superfamily)
MKGEAKVSSQFATIDDYIRSRPAAVQSTLEQVRQTIRRAAPCASERISYQMPTLTLNGRDLVYFAAWKRHIALYSLPAADPEFERQLATYRGPKGTLAFPLAEPIPYGLIEHVVALRAKQQGDYS